MANIINDNHQRLLAVRRGFRESEEFLGGVIVNDDGFLPGTYTTIIPSERMLIMQITTVGPDRLNI